MDPARPATTVDIDLIGAIGAAGFHDDPVMSWVLPDPATRRAKLTAMFTSLARDMVPANGTVHLVDDAAVALWRSPDFEHGRTAADRVQEEGAGGDRPGMPLDDGELDRLAALGATMMAGHPHEPHWYLNVLSTVPARQGQGLGARAVAPVLEVCDRDGVRAYLESTNPRNLPFYRRLGFVDAGELTVPGGPTLTAMWRGTRG
jgi:GNAT superfamily N-acetyltransferase